MPETQVYTQAWLCLLPPLAYLYGSAPFSYLLPKLLKGVDIRRVGSGNVGATNAARVLGFRFFPLLLLLDLSKGLLPTLAAKLLVRAGPYNPAPLVVGTALGAMLGHAFPVYLGFKGGKAVATGSGVFLVLAPKALLTAGVAWAVVFLAWRYVSLASISAALMLPVCVWRLHPDPFGAGRCLLALSVLGGLFVIVLHQSNIRRLLAGTEHRIGRPRAEPPPPPGEAS
jgi:glycerol-3-phosphate acyltransferase PlsY